MRFYRGFFFGALPDRFSDSIPTLTAGVLFGFYRGLGFTVTALVLFGSIGVSIGVSIRVLLGFYWGFYFRASKETTGVLLGFLFPTMKGNYWGSIGVSISDLERKGLGGAERPYGGFLHGFQESFNKGVQVGFSADCCKGSATILSGCFFGA